MVAIPDARLQERACACVIPRRGSDPLTFERMQEFVLRDQVSGGA